MPTALVVKGAWMASVGAFLTAWRSSRGVDVRALIGTRTLIAQLRYRMKRHRRWDDIILKVARSEVQLTRKQIK
ncbi:hypothetical protein CCUS01_02151 [Colletotrichum cuscutae]|uniref:Uncharacterized protein n=1 Tax=Colletotrichum cuscutae TaxID=1209917 RepID=A0AAI9U5C1_9PEZI|nr:hypothetical protein CCUS01_02151 [Colletotrichum cuscutae]